jgi:hypothetical protein
MSAVESLTRALSFIAARANKPFVVFGFIFADDVPRRMVLVRQLDLGVGECTATLGQTRLASQQSVIGI